MFQKKTTDQSIGTEAQNPLISELLFGSLRYYHSLSDAVDACLNRPLRDKDQDLYALMIVGAYQLIHTRIPDHAAINETVGAVSQLKKPWAKGLINAVLRQIAGTERDKAPAERSFKLPAWIMERFRRDFPDQAVALAQAAFERAPMCLRINVARISPADYRQQLQDAGLEAQPGYFPEQLVLSAPVAIRNLPGYAEGLVSVQDAGAQFAAHLLPEDARTPERILDACAAPGGKLFHFAERFPGARLTGVELSDERLDYLRQEASRLGHDNVRLLAGDATTLNWREAPEPFDLILLDAPCTGSGTLRRHPDIKLLRGPEDLPAAATLQLQLLQNLWPLVAPGGSLIYCTCSLFAEENDAVIDAFLSGLADERANAASGSVPMPVLETLKLPTGAATRFGWQLLPLPAGEALPNTTVDGFYFARMTRQEKAR